VTNSSSKTQKARTVDKSEDEIISGEPRPLIPPGEYEAICYEMNISPCQGGSKRVFVQFRVYDGPLDGTELFMCCLKPSGKLRERLKLHIQMSLALGRRPHKGERLSKKVFIGKLYRVKVRDTRRKFTTTNEIMPKFMQYSIVDTILETLTGADDE